MRGISADIERWRGRGEQVAIATVVATRRSAPRPVGSKLGVSAGGELAGSVSGGCVENEVFGVAREVLAGGPSRLLTYGISDDMALEVGLPCGGEIDVFVDAPDEAVLRRLLEASERGERAVHFTVVDGDEAGAELLVLESGETVGGGPAELTGHAEAIVRGKRSQLLELEGRTVFADVVGPPPRVLVFGAVDTAEALCKACRLIGWESIVADARAKFATGERIPSAGELVVGWPEDVLERVRPDHDTAVVVLTHEEKFDIPTLVGALATEAFYVGALGSRRAQERRRERLLGAGVDEVELERIWGPSGLDLGAQSPEETALSILGEILAVRAGRGGGHLKEAGGRIHADVA
ncbi:MAG: XdhC family protein [Thermoleophilia bacterium]|nr:XdhC family protein [Thermoleophilia bacterium]